MSRWLEHIKATMASNPDVKKKHGLKGILKLASKSYKKTAKVGHGVVKHAHKKRTHRHHKHSAKKHHKHSAKKHHKHSAKKHHKHSAKKPHKRKSSKRKHRKH